MNSRTCATSLTTWVLTLVAIVLTSGCGSSRTERKDSAFPPDDGYPPELPLDSRYTSCEVDTDCITLHLGRCGGFPVHVNCDSVEEVWCQFSQSRKGTYACDGEMYGSEPLEPWMLCIEGTCGRGPTPDGAVEPDCMGLMSDLQNGRHECDDAWR